jgi:hypothetical protein
MPPQIVPQARAQQARDRLTDCRLTAEKYRAIEDQARKRAAETDGEARAAALQAAKSAAHVASLVEIEADEIEAQLDGEP